MPAPPPPHPPTGRLAARRAAAGLLLASAAAAWVWAWQQQVDTERSTAQARARAGAQALAEQQARERGRLLFEHGTGLPARMAGHVDELPALASRCSNCHAALPVASAALAAGPALGGDWLVALRSRRGGPPSRFDPASLCRLLATGRDPADVIVSTTMPRYAASAAQCQDLWAYLSADLASPR